MFNLGMGEITVILLLALIFLGPKKLPDLASGLGKLIRQIRKTTADVKNEIVLDDTFRKPFEELRDAVTLHARRAQAPRRRSRRAVRKQAEELEARSGGRRQRPGAKPPAPADPAAPSRSAPETSAPPAAAPAAAPPVTPAAPDRRRPVAAGRAPGRDLPAPAHAGAAAARAPRRRPQRVTPPDLQPRWRPNANMTQTLTEEDLLPPKKGAPRRRCRPPLPRRRAAAATRHARKARASVSTAPDPGPSPEQAPDHAIRTASPSTRRA